VFEVLLVKQLFVMPGDNPHGHADGWTAQPKGSRREAGEPERSKLHTNLSDGLAHTAPQLTAATLRHSTVLTEVETIDVERKVIPRIEIDTGNDAVTVTLSPPLAVFVPLSLHTSEELPLPTLMAGEPVNPSGSSAVKTASALVVAAPAAAKRHVDITLAAARVALFNARCLSHAGANDAIPSTININIGMTMANSTRACPCSDLLSVITK
jgi:hypothetical protein